MSDVLNRLREYAGKRREDRGVHNPWITAREAIEVADHIVALKAELAAVRAALVKYGRHLDNCGDADAHNNADIASCGCGFDAAIDKAREGK